MGGVSHEAASHKHNITPGSCYGLPLGDHPCYIASTFPASGPPDRREIGHSVNRVVATMHVILVQATHFGDHSRTVRIPLTLQNTQHHPMASRRVRTMAPHETKSLQHCPEFSEFLSVVQTKFVGKGKGLVRSVDKVVVEGGR